DQRLILFYHELLNQKRKSILFWKRCAASIAAILVVGFLASWLVNQHVEKTTAVSLSTLTVPRGARSNITLADGTEIWLNAGSELKYPVSFGSRERVVSLSGEGFFHVKSDPKHPFVVKTHNFDLKVTGTKFNIRSYTDAQFSSATLVEGKITLLPRNSNREIIINPGDKVNVNATDFSATVTHADVLADTSWRTGSYKFSRISFPDLVKLLERVYNVKISFSDERLRLFNYSGGINDQETITQVLEYLKLTTPIEYKAINSREFQITYRP
ncbi:MAG: FecR domain-containing protein, partial [Bacteroidota bacterium]|nr:FecR domain-containing protein [Bacteroidota bacterium]